MRETKMAQEAAEAPDRIAAMLAANADAVSGLAASLRDTPPRLVMTCARGSSDHACTYLQSLMHLHLGIPAMSLPPSVASVYGAAMDLRGALFVVVSQSGQSPDLIAGAKWAAGQGARVLALVNDATSPVATAAHTVLPLHAGAERSVAATKSCLASLAAALQLVAQASGDSSLTNTVRTLPATLAQAAGLDWSPALRVFEDATNALTVGRGPGLGPACEMALKLKETSVMHAEAVSSAEIMHGPLGVLQDGLPVLLIGQDDATLGSVRQLDALLREKEAAVCAAYEGAGGLPVVPGLHPAIAPLAALQSFYRFASDLAVLRGHNPDSPAHLRKVTETC